MQVGDPVMVASQRSKSQNGWLQETSTYPRLATVLAIEPGGYGVIVSASHEHGWGLSRGAWAQWVVDACEACGVPETQPIEVSYRHALTPAWFSL